MVFGSPSKNESGLVSAVSQLTVQSRVSRSCTFPVLACGSARCLGRSGAVSGPHSPPAGPPILLGQVSAPSEIFRHDHESTRSACLRQRHAVRAHIRGIAGSEGSESIVMEAWRGLSTIWISPGVERARQGNRQPRRRISCELLVKLALDL